MLPAGTVEVLPLPLGSLETLKLFLEACYRTSLDGKKNLKCFQNVSSSYPFSFILQDQFTIPKHTSLVVTLLTFPVLQGVGGPAAWAAEKWVGTAPFVPSAGIPQVLSPRRSHTATHFLYTTNMHFCYQLRRYVSSHGYIQKRINRVSHY